MGLAVGLAVLLAGFTGTAEPAAAEDDRDSGLKVAATIKPIHSLVAAIMQGAGRPVLLFPDARLAHRTRSPDETTRSMLAQTGILFRIDAGFETGTAAVGTKGKMLVVSLLRAAGVRLIDIRPGHRRVGAPRVRPKRSGSAPKVRRIASSKKAPGKIQRGGITFRTRNGKKGVTARKRDGASRSRPSARRRASGKSAGRRKPAVQKTTVVRPDPNIWLDPRNAIAMTRVIAKTLIARDPRNARKYSRNAAALIVTLEALDAHITGILRPVRTNRFAVLNNRLQYFEEQYLLRPTIELTLGLADMTDERAAKIGKQLEGGTMKCIVAPAALTPDQQDAMQPGGGRRVFAADPYGGGFDAGPGLYEKMMRAMAETYGQCLSLGSPPRKNGDGRKKAAAKPARK